MPVFGKAVAVCFLLGICAALWAPVLLPLSMGGPLAALGIVLWWRGRLLRLAGAVVAGVGWVGLHAGWVLAAQLPFAWEGREFSVTGTVANLPEHEARRTRFQLRVDDGDANAHLQWYDDFGASSVGPRMQLHAGQRWQMRVRLRVPRGLSNPGGFDAERHALAQRISATGLVRAPGTARLLTPPSGVAAWRQHMASRIAAQVPSASSRYVQALALGDTRGLTDEDWQLLRATGLTHLIAISGFHVGMVAVCGAWLIGGIWRLLPWLGLRWPRPQAAAAGAFIAALVYAAVAGFALPTVRTVLMVAVIVLARLWRRPVDVLGSLGLAALAVLLADPLSVLSAGFWLSFAGVAWLAWCLQERTHWLRGFLSAQRVATLGLLPLSAMLFGQASLIGPLANLVAIPWWSLVVVPLAVLGTALEAVWSESGAWVWRASAGCFDLSWPLFEFLADSRFSLWWLPEPAWFALPLALLGALWMLLPNGVPGRPLAVLLWLPLLMPWRELPDAGEFELVMMDVGQGLAVLVRTQHHSLLYDAGPAVRDGFDAGERVVVPALRALGVKQLDRLVLSHGDSDHAGGVSAVQAALPVAGLHAPPGLAWPGGTDCVAGQSWEWEGVRFEFLHPVAGFPYLRNESSCVLKVGSRHGSVLLPGDVGAVIERGLVTRVRSELKAEVVVLPHHGSGNSSSAGFVAATGARLALVSAGHGNRFAHPRPEVVARWRRADAEVLGTAGSGAVRVWLRRGGLQLRERRIARSRWWDAAERARAAAILSGIEQTAMAPEGLERVGTGQGRRLADAAVVAVGGAGFGDRPGAFLEPAP
ncbi:transporter [Stenotrophomonas humi]|uniref:Transporter n=1 Tax=Stenotrophomonas humi TaxID=405444 RepID=A0A0R0C3K9_9GAMM|nr:DNA internalization-related competence protein ComEC/Rec2 [Stenotrophomonas humi]KRG63947.1 transporter [Stenotrophomonas humi]